MEYICNTIEEAHKALCESKSNQGDVFICSDEVFKYLCNQPERSKREDSITYLDDLDKTDAYQFTIALGEIERTSREMRCSELYGDIET